MLFSAENITCYKGWALVRIDRRRYYLGVHNIHFNIFKLTWTAMDLTIPCFKIKLSYPIRRPADKIKDAVFYECS